MRFEILGEISGIETFATASGIRENARLRNSAFAVGGENARELLVSGWRMAIGTKHLGSGAGNSRSSICFETHTVARAKQLVVCIDNEGYEASLEKRTTYVALRDPTAEQHELIRVIDESGDDYLYPKTFFHEIELPQAVRTAVLAAA